MKYTLIGSLKVSQICLGCMGFGDASQGMHSWTLPYEDSKKIIFHALSISLIQRWLISQAQVKNT